MKTGGTLAELLMSLAVLGIVAGLTAHLAVGQLRFVRGVNEVAAVRGQVHEAGAILQAALWGVAPAAGDVVFAADSALDVRVGSGVAIACEGGIGAATVPAPAPAGFTLAALEAQPEAGEPVSLFLADSAQAGWIGATVAAPPVGVSCPPATAAGAGWRLRFAEPLTIPSGAVLRFTRRVRFNLYRASDGRWYLGARDWNAATAQLNTIQPVAGPLEPYSADALRSGLSLRYFDAAGVELVAPVDARRIARVDVSLRSKTRGVIRIPGQATALTGTYVDSLAVVVALRNRP